MTFTGGGYIYFLLGMAVAWGVPLIIGAIILHLHRKRDDNNDDNS